MLATVLRYGLFTILCLVGPVFIVSTNPEKIPVLLLVVPFIWLFSVLFMGTWIVLRRGSDSSYRQRVLVSGAVASVAVLLALFQSIHQLSPRDVFLSVGLAALAVVYMLRADFIS